MIFGTRPAGGKNAGQPFLPGNGGSENFRIPCLWAGSRGVLYAAADVRWDREADGGGLDIAFSRSCDGGTTWEYSFPAWFGDNGNRYDPASSTMMDPQLTVSGDTVYLLFDLFPHGRSMLTGDGGTESRLLPGGGLDAEGRLRLRRKGETEYRFTLCGSRILDENGLPVPGVDVSPWFDLPASGNLFFDGAAFEVYPTSYLCLLISPDGGRTWENPRLLPGKTDAEAFLGTGPGRGLETRAGDLLFPVYNGKEASFLYSSDGGKSFCRSPSVPGTETQLVEIREGWIRMFIRNPSGFLTYADYKRTADGYAPLAPVRTEVALCSACMLSAVLLPEDGRGIKRIAVSSPSGVVSRDSRFGGMLRLFILHPDGTMAPEREIPISSRDAFFAYSCLAPLSGWDLGILYEDGCIRYQGLPQGPGFSHMVFRRIALS